MATIGNERYLRHLWLLGEGGLLVLRRIVTTEAARSGHTLEQLLLNNQTSFQNILKEQNQILFLSSTTANGNVDTWDMSLIFLVLKRLFWQNLTPAIRSCVLTLKTYRNDIQGHPTKVSMDASDYTTNRQLLEQSLRSIAIGINVKVEIEDIITRTFSDNIDIHLAFKHLKEIHEYKTSMISALEENFKRVYTEISDLNKHTQQGFANIKDDIARAKEVAVSTEGRVKNLENTLASVNEQTASTKECVADIEESVERVNKTTYCTEGRVENIENSVTSVKENTESTKGLVENIENNVARVKEAVDSTEGRVENLENTLTSVKEKAEATKECVNNIEETVSRVKEVADSRDGRIHNVKSTVVRVKDVIVSTERRVNDIENTVASVKENTDSTKGHIETIERTYRVLMQFRQMFVQKEKTKTTEQLHTIIQAECENEEKQMKATILLFDLVKMIQVDDKIKDEEIKKLISQRVQWYGGLTLQLIEDLVHWFSDMNALPDALPCSAKLGSIRIPISCTHVSGLLTFLKYMISSQCSQRLSSISSTLFALLGFHCSLTWKIESMDLHKSLSSHLAQMESKRLVLPFHTTSIEGLTQVLNMFIGKERNSHVEKISETLSKIFGETIRLETYVDKIQYLEAAKERDQESTDDASVASTCTDEKTRSKSLPEDKDKKSTDEVSVASTFTDEKTRSKTLPEYKEKELTDDVSVASTCTYEKTRSKSLPEYKEYRKLVEQLEKWPMKLYKKKQELMGHAEIPEGVVIPKEKCCVPKIHTPVFFDLETTDLEKESTDDVSVASTFTDENTRSKSFPEYTEKESTDDVSVASTFTDEKTRSKSFPEYKAFDNQEDASKKIQFFIPIRSELTKDFAANISSLSKDLKDNDIYYNSEEVSEASLLVVVSLISSRLEPDMDSAIGKIKYNKPFVVLILHTGVKSSLPELSTSIKLDRMEKYKNITFIDIAYTIENKLYDCDINARAKETFKQFIICSRNQEQERQQQPFLVKLSIELRKTRFNLFHITTAVVVAVAGTVAFSMAWK